MAWDDSCGSTTASNFFSPHCYIFHTVAPAEHLFISLIDRSSPSLRRQSPFTLRSLLHLSTSSLCTPSASLLITLAVNRHHPSISSPTLFVYSFPFQQYVLKSVLPDPHPDVPKKRKTFYPSFSLFTMRP
jgi:hypothetical protein